MINEILMRWENSLAIHQEGTTGQIATWCKTASLLKADQKRAVSCRERSFSDTQRNHSLDTGQFVHEKSYQVLLWM